MGNKKKSDSYAVYKAENRVFKNKIKKLTRHCKKYPNDEKATENLIRIEKEGYKGRTKPLVGKVVKRAGEGGITIAKVKYIWHPIMGQKTPGEQLSELLGIPVPKPKRKFKPKITHKPRRK